ncbi:hypothetical protein GCM10025876_04410 [Demequina litorisediminis]|uniref:Uncharacterized protein n=1 Tax=Demequina litorisediminis TaxID=1849022 RepID=A0ABQ6IB76_9MICO|nr:hypothetical protein GCM10025876_04410 [Demequina litorisediminis]
MVSCAVGVGSGVADAVADGSGVGDALTLGSGVALGVGLTLGEGEADGLAAAVVALAAGAVAAGSSLADAGTPHVVTASAATITAVAEARSAWRASGREGVKMAGLLGQGWGTVRWSTAALRGSCGRIGQREARCGSLHIIGERRAYP